MTALVDGLVRRQLVERRTATDDRRRVEHVLTAEGKRALAAADRRADDALTSVLDALDPDVVTDTRLALSRLQDALDARLLEKLQ